MNVYVESNFVMEQALEQEQCESCEELVRLASDGSIRLVIPAFSLAEPDIALMRKASDRARLSTELQRHLSELERSRPYRDSPGNFSELLAVLIKSAERESEGLQRTKDAILQTAEVIPLDSDIFYRASGIQVGLGMSPQDSIVLASIVKHLAETKPIESCFLNRNTKDFDDPNVRQVWEEFACKFYGRFDAGLKFVKDRLRNVG